MDVYQERLRKIRKLLLAGAALFLVFSGLLVNFELTAPEADQSDICAPQPDGPMISNGVICESENIIENTCANFRVTRLKPHGLTKGVKEFSIFGGWALLSTGENASVIAETSPRAWIDLNGDGKLGPGDAVQSFGVLVTGQLGRGRFVVSGDDAVFQNQFLKEGNLRLATNLAAWLAELPI